MLSSVMATVVSRMYFGDHPAFIIPAYTLISAWELGFYLVSTGEGTPHKVHVRAPSFVHMGALHRLLEGYQLADIIPTFGSVNMIGGECDR